MSRSANPDKGHRFPPAIIQYAVWLYHRFNLSHRDIADLLAERRHYLGRAVNQDGDVVDVYLQARRNAEAAKRFFRRLLRSHGTSRFSSPDQAQRFLITHAVVYSLFNLQRHLAPAAFYRLHPARAFKRWNEAVAA